MNQQSIEHLDALLADYQRMVEEYREGVTNKDGIVTDEDDLKLLIKYDAILSRAQLAMGSIKSVSRETTGL